MITWQWLLVTFFAGCLVGYYVKDNLAKPDIVNQIKQKGRGNLLNLLKRNKKASKE